MIFDIMSTFQMVYILKTYELHNNFMADFMMSYICNSWCAEYISMALDPVHGYNPYVPRTFTNLFQIAVCIALFFK